MRLPVKLVAAVKARSARGFLVAFMRNYASINPIGCSGKDCLYAPENISPSCF